MGDTKCCETVEWLKERVHNKKHFTARLVAQLAELSGMEAELVAKGFGGLLLGVLALSNQAHFFANALLVAVPFVLIFVFPAEKPTDSSLMVYFSLFGALTVLDRGLERIPCYYVFKLALFFLLYAPPYVLHQKISDAIQEALKGKNGTEPLSEMSKSSRKSPPRSTTTAVSTPIVPVPAPVESAPPPPPPPADPSPSPVPVTPPVQEPSTPSKKNVPSPTKSSTDIAGGSKRFKVGQHPMEASSFHNLKSESDGFNSKLIGPGNNLNDMLFHPHDKLVFNAPFDYDNLTYHMKITNNSHHRIAYAVKGNSVPRVMANPAFGILEPREQRLIAVSVQKFNWNEFDYEKDRIAFDYVLLADTDKTKEFSLSLFQHSDSKRRKNIRIEYNP